jgi:hypothetical protein
MLGELGTIVASPQRVDKQGTGTQGVLLVERIMAGQNFYPLPLYSWCIDPAPAAFSIHVPKSPNTLQSPFNWLD